MPEEFNLESLTKAWKEFLKDYHEKDLLELANSYPEKRSLTVDYEDIEVFDEKLAVYLLEHPNSAIYAAELAIRDSMPPDVRAMVRKGVHFRVTSLSTTPLAYSEIRDLRSKHMGKFIAVKGLVRKATQVKPKIVDAVFQCARCLAVVHEPQGDTIFKEPIECYKDQGGCGKGAASTRFNLLTADVTLFKPPPYYRETAPPEGEPPNAPTPQVDKFTNSQGSIFVDTQKIEIQESPEDLRGGDQPERLTAFAEDDLCKKSSPGDKIIINGILRSLQKGIGQSKTTLFDWFLEVNSIEREEKEFESLEITPEEETEILKMSKDNDLYHKMVQSIAPTIYGMDMEKEALALQMFGGVRKELRDGTKLRGDIHILLVGDPGTAKSQLLRYCSNLVPRGIYASGKATTAAGLTAAAVHDESGFGEGRWTLEAGALVLADKGLACIDELDKMSEQDSSSMHEAMEQQRISVAKAGITATLQSRCAILAAANPKEGRFDEHSYLADQIDLSPALLSRFDVIFPLTDKPDRKKDVALASHIVQVHMAGEISQYRKNVPDQRYTKEDETKAMAIVEPPFRPEKIRKYIAYARSHVFPVMTPETAEIIEEYYVNIRAQSKPDADGGGAVPMTPRQIEALIRLSEASARVRLSKEVTSEDAERAKKIIEYFLRKVASEGGGFDIDSIATGVSHARKDRFQAIVDIVEEIDDGRGVTEEDILKRTSKEGISDEKVRKDIQRLLNDGRLWNPSGNKFKVMRREQR